MLKAQKRVDPHWQYLEEHGDGEVAPRFRIRALATSEQAEIMGSMAGGKLTSRACVACFRLGVMEIENVVDADDAAIHAPAQFLAQPNFLDEAIEIGGAVFDKSFLDEGDRKNS